MRVSLRYSFERVTEKDTSWPKIFREGKFSDALLQLRESSVDSMISSPSFSERSATTSFLQAYLQPRRQLCVSSSEPRCCLPSSLDVSATASFSLQSEFGGWGTKLFHFCYRCFKEVLFNLETTSTGALREFLTILDDSRL